MKSSFLIYLCSSILPFHWIILIPSLSANRIPNFQWRFLVSSIDRLWWQKIWKQIPTNMLKVNRHGEIIIFQAIDLSLNVIAFNQILAKQGTANILNGFSLQGQCTMDFGNSEIDVFFSSLWMTSIHRNKCLCSNVQCSMMISTTKTCNFL